MGQRGGPGIHRLLIKDASQFSIQVPAWPGKTFRISKWTLLPSVDSATRTLQLRLQVNNPDEALKPGMNAYLQLTSESAPMLLILQSADRQRQRAASDHRR